MLEILSQLITMHFCDSTSRNHEDKESLNQEVEQYVGKKTHFNQKHTSIEEDKLSMKKTVATLIEDIELTMWATLQHN